MKIINSMPAMLLLLVAFTMVPPGVESIGVAYGTQGDNLPPPSDVVNLYKSNNIPRMRIYKPDPDILHALSGSNIELVMGVDDTNQILPSLTNPDFAGDWVYKNIMSYNDVSFRYIVVGNEVIPGDKAQYVLQGMQNIQNALNNAGLNQIKVTTSVSYGIVDGYPPSNGAFRPPEMQPIVRYLASIGSRLLVNIYPYFAYTDPNANIQLDYALFTAPGTVVLDQNSGLSYQNLFDAMVDTVLWAMDKVVSDSTVSPMLDKKAPSLGIIPSETGWPKRGGPGGHGLLATSDAEGPESTQNAQTYNQNLINHVKQGTPKRPGEEVETYIFSMFDENQKPGAEIEQNFGLFYPNQQPAYPISFN